MNVQAPPLTAGLYTAVLEQDPVHAHEQSHAQTVLRVSSYHMLKKTLISSTHLSVLHLNQQAVTFLSVTQGGPKMTSCYRAKEAYTVVYRFAIQKSPSCISL